MQDWTHWKRYEKWFNFIHVTLPSMWYSSVPKEPMITPLREGLPHFPAEKDATKEAHFSLASSRVLNGNLYGVGSSEQIGKWQPRLKANQRDVEATSSPLGGLTVSHWEVCSMNKVYCCH